MCSHMLKYQDWYFFKLIQILECLERAEKYSKREISKNKKNTMSYKSPNDNTDWITKKNIWRGKKNGSLWCCQVKRSSIRRVSYWHWRKEYLGFKVVEVKWSRKLLNYLEKTPVAFIRTRLKAARFQKLLSGVLFPYAGEIADAN